LPRGNHENSDTFHKNFLFFLKNFVGSGILFLLEKNILGYISQFAFLQLLFC